MAGPNANIGHILPTSCLLCTQLMWGCTITLDLIFLLWMCIYMTVHVDICVYVCVKVRGTTLGITLGNTFYFPLDRDPRCPVRPRHLPVSASTYWNVKYSLPHLAIFHGLEESDSGSGSKSSALLRYSSALSWLWTVTTVHFRSHLAALLVLKAGKGFKTTDCLWAT